MLDREKIDAALAHKWYWEHGGSYGLWHIFQYDSSEQSRATYSSINTNSPQRSRTAAADIAKALNKAYAAGIAYGQADMLDRLDLYGHGEIVEIIQREMEAEERQAKQA